VSLPIPYNPDDADFIDRTSQGTEHQVSDIFNTMQTYLVPANINQYV